MISKIAAPTLVSALLLSGCSGAQTTSNSDVACKEPSPTEYPARYVTAYNAVPGRSSGQAQGQYQLCAHIIDCDANGVTVRFENVTGGLVRLRVGVRIFPTGEYADWDVVVRPGLQELTYSPSMGNPCGTLVAGKPMDDYLKMDVK